MTQPRIDAVDVYGGKKATGPQPPLIAGISKVTEAIYPDTSWPAWAAHFRSQPQIDHLGGFHWLVTASRVSIEKQFEAFVKGWDSVGGMRPGEFAITDVERTTWNGVVLPDPTPAEANEFLALSDGHFGPNRTLLYGNSGWSRFWEWRQANPWYPLWYANSNIDPADPKGGWQRSAALGAIAWQWGSPVAAVPGIVRASDGGPTPIDVNHIFHPEWFAALNSPEDDMPLIIHFTDAQAVMVTGDDDRVPGLVAEWSGSGNDPKVIPWLASLVKLGAKEITGTVADLAVGVWFRERDGGAVADIQDAKHKWTGSEFRGILPAHPQGGTGSGGTGTMPPFPTRVSGSLDLHGETFTGTLS